MCLSRMCGCERITYICLCVHKEVRIQYCFAYELREQGSCFAWCFPKCRTNVGQFYLQRVCEMCEDYFYYKYGKRHYETMIKRFLEYKEGKGWGSMKIDPRTIPSGILFRYKPTQREPQGVEEQQGQEHRQGYRQGYRQGHRQGHRQPFQPHQSMMAATPRRPDPTYTLGRDRPSVTVDNQYVMDSRYSRGNGKQTSIFTPSQVAEYTGNGLPSGLTVIPELAYLARGQGYVINRSPGLRQPTSGTGRAKPQLPRNVDRSSDVSLVKNLTKAAQNIEIPNIEYIEHEGMLVPRILPVPEGRRRTRMSTASDASNINAIDVIIAANTAPEPRVPSQSTAAEADKQERGAHKGSSTYFVMTHPDSTSPSGASARVQFSRSHQRVAVPPPQRLDGVLVADMKECTHHNQGGESGDCTACRGAFFRERGLPPTSYIQEESRSATQSRPPILLSVNTPPRSYSCAVQSCYCTDKDGDDERCPSCQERDSIAQEFKTTWI